jgi:hypothetical protein
MPAGKVNTVTLYPMYSHQPLPKGCIGSSSYCLALYVCKYLRAAPVHDHLSTTAVIPACSLQHHYAPHINSQHCPACPGHLTLSKFSTYSIPAKHLSGLSCLGEVVREVWTSLGHGHLITLPVVSCTALPIATSGAKPVTLLLPT